MKLRGVIIVDTQDAYDVPDETVGVDTTGRTWTFIAELYAWRSSEGDTCDHRRFVEQVTLTSLEVPR